MRPQAPRRLRHQFIAGLIALPLSVVPFLAYGALTAEGRLVRDRVVVALRPPKLPMLTEAEKRVAATRAPRYRDGVMVLAYHGIGSSDGEGGFVVTPGRFAEHLAALREAKMNVVTAAQVARAFAAGSRLPENAVMLSFDDGRADAMMFADPLLEEARMSATMFVIGSAASQPGVYYASWGSIEAYSRSGRWDIQSHTSASHREWRVEDGRMLPVLTSLAPRESLGRFRTRVRADLAAAAAAIAERTGRRPTAFAYPFGAYGAERTNHPAIRTIVREEVGRQYALAFHQDEQATVTLANQSHDPLGLRRLEVGNWSGLGLLEQISAAARRTRGEPVETPAIPTPSVPKPRVTPAAPSPDPTGTPPPGSPLPVVPVPSLPVPVCDETIVARPLGTCPPVLR